MGYSLFDTIYGYLKKYNDLSITIHHVIMFSIFFSCYVIGKNGQEMIWAAVLGEVTSIIFNLNKILRWNNVEGSVVLGLDIAFLLSFLFIRLGLMGPIMVNIHKNENTGFIMKFWPCGIFYMSLDWSWMMINKASKILYDVIFFDFFN